MSKQNKNTGHTLTPDIIEKYLNGELSHQEMHAVEKLMLNSDFDAEAMEGYEALGTDHIHQDLKQLESRLSERTEKHRRPSLFWLKIAASLLIMGVAAVLILNMDFESEQLKERAYHAESEESKPEKSADSATNTGDERDSLLALHEPTEAPAVKQPPPPADISTQSAGQKKDDAATIPEPEEPVVLDVPEEAEAVGMPELAEVIADTEEAETPELDVDLAMAKEAEVDDSAISALEGQVAGINVTRTELKEAEKAESRKKGTRKPATRAAASEFYNASRVISGRITSAEDGAAIPGANVIIKGTTIGTVTDLEGNYQIEIPAGIDPVLSVAFIGYRSEEVKAADYAEADIQLEADITQLSEVVVVGYGAEQETPIFIRATPVTGNADFKKYIEENLQLPEGTESDGKVKVVVEFDVLPTGHPANFNIIRNTSENRAYEDEAIRVIKEGPKWKPATRNGVPEASTVRVKVRF